MGYNTAIDGTNITISNGAGFQQIAASGVNNPTSFLPDIFFGGANVGISYITQSGTWQSITNNLVYCTGLLELISKGTSTGVATIALPQTASNTLVPSRLGIYCINLSVGFASTFILAQTISNTTTASLAKGNGITSTAMTDADFTNSSAIYYEGLFFK